MIIILLGTRRTLNDYSCSYGEVIIISWMSPPAPPAAAAAGAEGWRLKAGFQLFSPFGFQSRRCAARCRTHQRSAERRSALSPGQTELCSSASRRTLPLSAPLLAHFFPRSFRPFIVWRFGTACVEMLETVAPLKWTQVRFVSHG